MAGYIGSKAAVVSSGVERKKTYSITGSTTSLTGLNYTVGKVHVYQNGVRLLDGTDYTATNGTSITLTVAAQSGDNVVVVSQASFQLSEHYTSAEADAEFVTKTGDTMSGNLSLGDNDKAIFGAGSDASLHSDGTSGYARGFVLQNTSGNKDVLTFVDGGATSLYHNNSAKLATTSTGIDVTGTALNLDGGGSNPLLTLKNSATYYSTVSHDTFNVQNNGLKLSTQGTERMRIDSSGRLLVGTSSSRTVQGFNHKVQVEGTNASTASISIVRNTNSVDPPYITFGKTRSGSVGASGIVQQDDVLGRIDFTGANGSNLGSLGARIDARVDGTPGSSSDMPTRLTFQTSGDGSATPTERMRIDSSGKVGIGTSSPSYTLEVYKSSVGNVASFNSSSGNRSLDITSADNGAYLGAEWDRNINSAGGIHTWSVEDNEKMRIDSSGKVMIGTTTEGQGQADNLTISDSGHMGMTLRSTDSHECSIFFSDATSGAGEYAGAVQYSHSDNALIFSSNSVARMRIDSSGNLLVGKTSASIDVDGFMVHNSDYINSTNTSGSAAYFNRKGTDGDIVNFQNDGSSVGSISVSGSSTAYNTSSDYRLKENVVDLTGASARVNQLDVKRFNFIADDTNTLVDGFLAHEVADVVPEAITGTKDAVDDDGNPEYQGIDQSKLVPLLTAALQEALTEIASLKTRVQALEA